MESKKNSSNNSNKKEKKVKSKLIFLIIIVSLIIIIFGILFIRNNIKVENLIEGINKIDNLQGIWTIDGITFYEFDGRGNGILKVPADEYKFTYKIINNEINLDYESENAKDSDYEFYFENDENNKLILKGINETVGTYTLIKQ